MYVLCECIKSSAIHLHGCDGDVYYYHCVLGSFVSSILLLQVSTDIETPHANSTQSTFTFPFDLYVFCPVSVNFHEASRSAAGSLSCTTDLDF